MTDQPTAQLADFTITWHPDSGASSASRRAKLALLDTFGVALAGAAEDSSKIAAGIARREGATGQAAVIGHGWRGSASFAAFVNGVSGHATTTTHRPRSRQRDIPWFVLCQQRSPWPKRSKPPDKSSSKR